MLQLGCTLQHAHLDAWHIKQQTCCSQLQWGWFDEALMLGYGSFLLCPVSALLAKN
jgi:hypothetical protein